MNRVIEKHFTYLDHVDRLDNASGEHTGGTAIDEGLHGIPDTNRSYFFLFRHLLFFWGIETAKLGEERFRAERERETHLGGEERKQVKLYVLLYYPNSAQL